MYISKRFRADLISAYEGTIEIETLIKQHEGFLRGLVKYSLRYKTDWFVNDEDDFYQEACYWLIQSMWDWDATKTPDIARYVVYNIGCRLGNIVKTERSSSRHPDPNKSRKIDIWGSPYKDSDSTLQLLW